MNRKQELHVSCPVTIPLYVMHVDLWDPSTDISNNSAVRHLLNAMCGLTQVVVPTITTEKKSEHLAKLFMEAVVILFVMVAIIVVNYGSWFKSVFKYMCTALGII